MKIAIVPSLLLCCSHALAASSATADLQVTYSLSALDPDSAIAPNVVWAGEGSSRASATIIANFAGDRGANGRGFEEIGAGLHESFMSALSELRVGDGGASLHASATGFGLGFREHPSGDEHPTVYAAYLSAADSFALGPNTQMTWSATYAARARSDGRTRSLYGESWSEAASASVGLLLQMDDGQRREFVIGSTPEGVVGSFSMTLQNSGAEPLWGIAAMEANIGGVGLLPIPEPGTFALMALGVAALCGMRGMRGMGGRRTHLLR